MEVLSKEWYFRCRNVLFCFCFLLCLSMTGCILLVSQFPNQALTKNLDSQQPKNHWPQRKWSFFTMFIAVRTFKIYFLSNFQIYNTVLLPMVTMLNITYLELIYLITGSVYLWTTFTHFSHPPHKPHFWQPPIHSLFLGVWVFFDSSYKWEHIVFVFFVWLISFSIMLSRFSHVFTITVFSSFLWWNNIPFI